MATAATPQAVDPAMLASKRVVFCGNLPSNATVTTLRAAFVPFGEIKSLDLPTDYSTGNHRGFCFVEFDDPDDAAEAIYNMDGATFLQHTLSCSTAQPNQLHKLTEEAVWKSDEWFQQQTNNNQKAEQQLEIDAQALKET